MVRAVAIGVLDFDKMISNHCFHIDKTAFIKERWESCDDVTLITRPRRFGKMLAMSMADYFSIQHAGRTDLFEGLSIWQNGKYRKMLGRGMKRFSLNWHEALSLCPGRPADNALRVLAARTSVVVRMQC